MPHNDNLGNKLAAMRGGGGGMKGDMGGKKDMMGASDMQLPANDTEQYRAQVEAIDPASLVDLVLDLAKNVTPDEFDAALASYSGAAPAESATSAIEATPTGQ